MQLVRQYKNSAEDILRIDSIVMVNKNNTCAAAANTHTYGRDLKTTFIHGPANRTVATIEVIGDYDTIETSSSSFTWAAWISPPGKCNMSDLPIVGNTV